MVGRNSHEKVKTIKYLGPLLTNNQNFVQEEINVDLKQEIHVTVESKYYSPHEFSLRI